MSISSRLRMLALLPALVVPLGGVASAAEAPPSPDICVAIGIDGPDAPQTDATVTSFRDALATRPVLIPSPVVVDWTDGDVLRLAIWTESSPGADAWAPSDVEDACRLDAGPRTWSTSIAGAFLRAGTKRELAAQRTTPGFTSEIDVEWDEAADLVRTVLTFSGPLGIPNGTCWMDDIVSTDGDGGTRAATTTGSETSPFGDGVCGRFEEYLSAGGAGAQALVLLPREVGLADGRVLRLGVDGVDVRDDAVEMWGSLGVAAP